MLDAKLLAVIQAIGADIKALIARANPVILRTTATQATSSATLATITGLSNAVVASGTYRVTGRVIFQSAGLTTGASIGFTSPAGSTGLFVIAIPSTALISTGTSTVRTTGASGSGTTSSVAAIATNMVATIDGILMVGTTAGTFALQVAAGGVAAAVTVQPGSTLVLEKLA